MRNGWLFFTNWDLDGGCQYILPAECHLAQGFGAHFLSQFGSLVDISFYHSSHFVSSGSVVLQEAFSCISKFAGGLFIWISTGANSNTHRKLSRNSRSSDPRNHQSSTQIKHVTSSRHKPAWMHFGSTSDTGSAVPVHFAQIATSTLRGLWKQVEQKHALPMLSLAAALIPPFENLSSKVLSDSLPLDKNDEHINGSIDQSIIEYDYRACSSLPLSNISWARDAIEPKTGIKFPTILDTPLGGDNAHMTTEVLVGIGSRSMRIIRIKTLKVYAFGLYVHPDSVCEKLGPKYASVPISELKNQSEFFEDFLREDIRMTVRLVVNCNGLKLNTVRDAFEKSLRARLQKMNPNTDYECLGAFGSYFMQDIPLSAGTTIDFRQTADGHLITEIGGRHVGAVQSKDLCRAFFDMYVGDVPVSVQTKQEIAQNVASLIRRC